MEFAHKNNLKLLTTKGYTSHRGYLLKNTKDNSYIVCSNLTEDDKGCYNWDWGHYLNTYEEALKCLYESEIDDLLYKIRIAVNSGIDEFTSISAEDYKKMDSFELREVVERLGRHIKNDIKDLLTN